MSLHGSMDVQSACPKQRLFGNFFVDVDGCRKLMREKQVIASGGAVLHAMLNKPFWLSNHIDLYVSRPSFGGEGILQWHGFLVAEGYSLARELRDGLHRVGKVCAVYSFRCV